MFRLVHLDDSIVTLEAKYEVVPLPFRLCEDISYPVVQSLGIGSAALGASTDGLIMLVMAYFLLQSHGTSRRYDPHLPVSYHGLTTENQHA